MYCIPNTSTTGQPYIESYGHNEWVVIKRWVWPKIDNTKKTEDKDKDTDDYLSRMGINV